MFRKHRSELEKQIRQFEKDKRTRRQFYSEHTEVVETMMRLREIARLANELDPRVFGDGPESEVWRRNIGLIKATTKVLLRRARFQWATFWED